MGWRVGRWIGGRYGVGRLVRFPPVSSGCPFSVDDVMNDFHAIS